VQLTCSSIIDARFLNASDEWSSKSILNLSLRDLKDEYTVIVAKVVTVGPNGPVVGFSAVGPTTGAVVGNLLGVVVLEVTGPAVKGKKKKRWLSHSYIYIYIYIYI